MNIIRHGFMGVLLVLLSTYSMAQDTTFTTLLEDVEKGCPEVWHELTVSINPEAYEATVNPTDFFGPSPDQADFETIYQSVYGQPDPITAAEMAAVVASPAAISLACNAHRKVFFETLLSTNTADSDAALEAALGVANAVDFSSRQWSVGDLRVTSRATAEDGWVFPTGQTVGSAASNADLKGEQYKELFEVVKMLAPNNSSTTWESNQAVQLPDMRGRTIFAANNMGGSVSPDTNVVLDATDAGVLGGTFGKDKRVMTQAQMPSHTHSMNSVGSHGHTAGTVGNHAHTSNNSPSHSHSMGYAGTHQHRLRSSVFTGSGAGRSDYNYFEGRARPNYQNLIGTGSVESSGNHKHTVGNGGVHNHTINGAGSHGHSIAANGNHAHTNNNAGGSQAVYSTPPGIALHIEMKY